MKPALFIDGWFTSCQFLLQFTDQILRSSNAFVHLTSRESKVLSALIEGSETGVLLEDIPNLLGHELSGRSVQTVRTHIYNIKAKLSVISQGRVTIFFNPQARRYLLVEA